MTRKVPSYSTKLDDVVIETDKGKEYSVGEIKHSKKIQKSVTPKQDLSWYIKWISSVFILCSMSIRGVQGLQVYDLMLSLVGVIGWMWVGFLWKDRALILLNGVGIVLFVNTLLRDYLV